MHANDSMKSLVSGMTKNMPGNIAIKICSVLFMSHFEIPDARFSSSPCACNKPMFTLTSIKKILLKHVHSLIKCKINTDVLILTRHVSCIHYQHPRKTDTNEIILIGQLILFRPVSYSVFSVTDGFIFC